MRYAFLFLPILSLTVCTLIIRFEVQSARRRGSTLTRNEMGQIIVALLLGGIAIIFVLFLFLKSHIG